MSAQLLIQVNNCDIILQADTEAMSVAVSPTVGVPSIAPIAEFSVNGCDVTPAAGRDICHVRALFPIDVCDVSAAAAGRDFFIVIHPIYTFRCVRWKNCASAPINAMYSGRRPPIEAM